MKLIQELVYKPIFYMDAERTLTTILSKELLGR
jgi:hypothetical protein